MFFSKGASPMIRNRMFIATAMAVALLSGCQPDEQETAQTTESIASPAPVAQQPAGAITAAANVTTERLLNAANEPSQWMMVGGTYEERHYSPLAEIKSDNIDKLGLSWFA